MIISVRKEEGCGTAKISEGALGITEKTILNVKLNFIAKHLFRAASLSIWTKNRRIKWADFLIVIIQIFFWNHFGTIFAFNWCFIRGLLTVFGNMLLQILGLNLNFTKFAFNRTECVNMPVRLTAKIFFVFWQQSQCLVSSVSCK